MIEKAHKHSTVNAENVEIVTVAGNLNRSSARKSSFSKLLFFSCNSKGSGDCKGFCGVRDEWTEPL